MRPGDERITLGIGGNQTVAKSAAHQSDQDSSKDAGDGDSD